MKSLIARFLGLLTVEQAADLARAAREMAAREYGADLALYADENMRLLDRLDDLDAIGAPRETAPMRPPMWICSR